MTVRFRVVPPADRGSEGGSRPLLRATIAPGDLGARPVLRVEHAPGRHMRVVSAGRVVLWAKVKSFYEGVWLLAAPPSARTSTCVEPIPMADVRAVKHEPGTELWHEAWARHFAAALSASPSSILHPGLWQIAAGGALPCDPRRSSADAQGFVAIHAATGPVFETWALNGSHATSPMRPWSPDGAARVKALRKLARDGTLPPLLLWFVSGLDMHVLLDGHDRALAARLEGVPLARLVLTAGRDLHWTPDPRRLEGELERAEVALDRAATSPEGLRKSAFDAIQRRLVGAFSEGRCFVPKTRAYRMAGGADAWRREVAARLAELDAPGDHAMLAR